MTIIADQVFAPGERVVRGTSVAVKVVAAEGREGAIMIPGTMHSVQGRIEMRVDPETGIAAINLEPNTGTPANNYYQWIRQVPGSPPTVESIEVPANPASSTLSAGVTLPASTIPVADATSFAAATPEIPGLVSIGGQIVLYTGKTGTTLTGAFGGEGTFALGTTVTQGYWVGHVLIDPPASLPTFLSELLADEIADRIADVDAEEARAVAVETALAAAKVDKATLNANTVLGAISDDTPVALTGAQVAGFIPAGTFALPSDVAAEEAARIAADATKAGKAAHETVTGNWTHDGTTDFDGAARFKAKPWVDVTHADVGMLGDDSQDNASRIPTAEALAQEQFWPSGTYRLGRSAVGSREIVPAKTKTLLTSAVSVAAGPAYTTASFTTAADRLTILEVASKDAGTGAAISSITDTAGRVWDLISTVQASNIRLSVYRCMAAGTGTATITFAGNQTGVRWHITETPNVPTGANGANAVGPPVTNRTAAVTSSVLAPVFSRFGSGVHTSTMLDANADMTAGPFLIELTDGSLSTAGGRLQTAWAPSPITPSVTWASNQLVLAVGFEVKAATTAVASANAGETIRLQYGAVIKPLANQVVEIAGKLDESIDWRIFDESLGGRVTLAFGSKTRRVRPEWWGAVGDGVANDTAAVMAAKNAIRGRGGKGRILFSPGKTYAIDPTNDPNTNPLHFDAQFTAWQVEIPEGTVIKARTNGLTHYQIINVQQAQNGAIFGGGTLYGDLETHTYTSSPPHALNQYGHCIQIMGGKDIRVRDITLTKAWGDGAYIAEHGSSGTRSENIYFERVDAIDNRRESIGLMDGRNVWLMACKLNDSGLTTNLLDPNANTGPRSGLDIEPNASELVEDLYVVGCQFKGNAGRGINAAGEAYGLGSKRWYFYGGDCTANGWGGGGDDDGACFGYVSDLYASDMLFADNVEHGMLVMGACNGSFTSCRSVRNGVSGFRVDQLPAGYRVDFVGCRSAGNTAYGWDLVPGVGGGDVTVDSMRSEGDAAGGGLECIRIAGNVRIDGGRILRTMDEIQRIAITGGPTAGNVQLTVDAQTTANIAHNATAAAVQTALEALSNVGVGNVEVTGGPWPNSPMRVRFRGALAGTNRTQMTATHTLTGGTAPAVGISTVQNGGGNSTYLVRVNASSTAHLIGLHGVGTGTTGVLNDLSTGTVMRGCTGTLASEATTTATVPSGSTSVTVNHNCVKAPTHVTLTATNSMGNAAKAWVTNKTATQVTVNVNIDPGAGGATFDVFSQVT